MLLNENRDHLTPSRPMSTSTRRIIAAWYLLLQGIGALVWWAAILWWPKSHAVLIPHSITRDWMLVLLPADVLLFIGGSFFSGCMLLRGSPIAMPALAIHAGAALYAAIFAIVVAVTTQSAWLSATMMLVPLVALPLVLWSLMEQEHADAV